MKTDQRGLIERYQSIDRAYGPRLKAVLARVRQACRDVGKRIQSQMVPQAEGAQIHAELLSFIKLLQGLSKQYGPSQS